jgi:hypothetical protein
MPRIEQIKFLLKSCNQNQRRRIFHFLRAEFPIHPIETQLNAKAEIILEAIARSSDLTQRGVRGVIAEAAFDQNVVSRCKYLDRQLVSGDPPYDFLLGLGENAIRIQVKMQRLKAHKPMMANQAYRRLPSDMYVVETQRTRGGREPTTGEDTRPYRFGEFDILAVSMHPSTNDWASFMYTICNWLLPREENSNLILKFQPVPMRPDSNWTDNFDTCVKWFQSGVKKRIL